MYHGMVAGLAKPVLSYAAEVGKPTAYLELIRLIYLIAAIY